MDEACEGSRKRERASAVGFGDLGMTETGKGYSKAQGLADF